MGLGGWYWRIMEVYKDDWGLAVVHWVGAGFYA